MTLMVSVDLLSKIPMERYMSHKLTAQEVCNLSPVKQGMHTPELHFCLLCEKAIGLHYPVFDLSRSRV